MAIKQIQTFTISYIGDGSTTSQDFDLTNYIKSLNILPNTPSEVVGFNGAGQPISNITLAGNTISVTWTSAPPSTIYSFSVTLEF